MKESTYVKRTQRFVVMYAKRIRSQIPNDHFDVLVAETRDAQSADEMQEVLRFFWCMCVDPYRKVIDLYDNLFAFVFVAHYVYHRHFSSPNPEN